MRTFTDIYVGTELIFTFEGRRFFLSSIADEPGIAELVEGGIDIDLSFYKTENWRQNFGITDTEWAAFEVQFNAALAENLMSLIETIRDRAEGRRTRAEAERQAAIERELRKQEKCLVLDIGKAIYLAVVERPGKQLLEFRHDWDWLDPVRKPISKALHDMLITEIGINEKETALIARQQEDLHDDDEEKLVEYDSEDLPFCMPQYRRQDANG